jgi:thymidylate synthase (FAD)
MQYVSVLDDIGHVCYVSHMGTDLTVVNSARVSFDKESHWEIDQDAQERLINSKSKFNDTDIQVLPERDKKLIKYLASHNHWTPFAHPQITLRIKAPVSIRTQLFKHKVGFTENEVSRRYVNTSPEFYSPLWRNSPTDGAKQGSSGFVESTERLEFYNQESSNLYRYAFELYDKLIEDGIAPEQARFMLPQGMYTEWYWTGSLAAFARVCKQRTDKSAQWEVQEYAKGISQIISPLFPVSWQYLIGNNNENY